MNYNKVMLAGHITRDPEIRYTPSGSAIAKFAIAVNRKWKTEAGEKEEVTFVDIDAFGKTAENIAKHFKKGRAIFIEGRLKLDQWEDKTNGQKRQRLCVAADTFSFCGSGGTDGKPEKQRGEAPKPQELPTSDPTEDGDVPF